MSVEQFGEMPDGTAVERVTICGGGLTAKILSFGAIIQDLRLDGHPKSLVLGFDRLDDYRTYGAHIGATAGRVANRICDGRFELGGKTYELDINFIGKHSLHGGTQGIGVRVWRFDKVQDNAVHMSLDLADGEMGFPGNMTIKLVYTLLDNGVLDIDMKATSDADTLCNLAHHGYFNLDGEGDILDHELQIDAERYLDITAELIPTGKILSVDGQNIDFRKKKSIRSAHEIKPIDNNLCIEETAGSLRRVATLSSPKSGVSMDVLTTEPGLQAYDAVNLKAGTPALDGGTTGVCGGVCLEPQIWPDAIHHPNFPSAVLKVGETYHQQTQYAFHKA